MRVALITGCSSGIGKATALAMAESGFITYATARKVVTLDGLRAAGCETVELDVTSEESIQAAFAHVRANGHSVSVLVNNAGYGEYGPIEELDMEDVRRQFETNVFGLIRMCQLVLPSMRRKGEGRIVNVSSMGGEMVMPLGGAYHASKFAVEAISDALRLEVARFGIKVVVIQPGPIKTKFGDRFSSSRAVAPSSGPYDRFKTIIRDRYMEFYKDPIGGATSEQVAEVILEAATAPSPRTRVKISPIGNLLPRLRKVTPDRFWDEAMDRHFRDAFQSLNERK